MGIPFLGYEDLNELIEELWQDYTFRYKGETYMLSTEGLGSRKHKVEKKCLSHQTGDHQHYLDTLQSFDTWEELFENATFQDGVKIKDVIGTDEIEPG